MTKLEQLRALMKARLYIPCSGCYESIDGQPPEGAKLHPEHGCYLGSGCRDCQGRGFRVMEYSAEDLAEVYCPFCFKSHDEGHTKVEANGLTFIGCPNYPEDAPPVPVTALAKLEAPT